VNNVVYLIDFPSGHYYIGSTKSADYRKRDHFRKLENGKHSNLHMQRVFNLHGTPQFTVIAQCSDREGAYSVEQLLLDKHFGNEKCLNAMKYALIMDDEACAKMSAAQKGRKREPHNDEHRAKLSAANKGKKRPPFSEEHREKIGAAKKGQRHSAEACAKMSAAKRNMSDETREKMSASRKGKIFSIETRAKLSAATKLYWEKRRGESND